MSFPASRWWSPTAVVLCFFAGCAGPTARTPVAPPPAAAAPKPPTDEEQIDALLARMSLEQKIGQIMVIGFDGVSYDPGFRDMIEHHAVGGVIFFGRNVDSPAQVARLTNDLQASALGASGVGLLIAIDQEGGRVARLTADKGFTEFPGGMAIGASARDAEQAGANARRVGAAMAQEMKAVGINTDFAPDLDVNNNPANPVIGIRSFGSDPRRVAAIGVGFIEGLQAEGVLAFGKHFPGHGDTGTDSHVELPVVSHARARLDTVEFVPFRAAIAAKVAGIMSAHVSFPTIDSTPGLPGTLSSKVLTGLLRTELGFEGLVVTDSLEMGALGRSGFPAPRAAARALAAGADVLLFNSGYKLHQEAIAQIAADVTSGTIPLARLNEAVRRTLVAKARFGLLDPAPVDPLKAGEICASPAHRTLAADIAAASVTLVRDQAGRLPLPSGVPPVVLAVPTALKLGEALHGVTVRLPENPSDADATAALKAVQSHPGATVVMTLAGGGRNQADLARRVIATGAKVVLVAVREPYDLVPFASKGSDAAAKKAALVAGYGANPPTLQALADVLQGVRKPAGHLPVELPGAYPLGAGLEKFAKR